MCVILQLPLGPPGKACDIAVAICPSRLEGEVASLEAHLDSMRSVYMLNADKLEYNVRVLSE